MSEVALVEAPPRQTQSSPPPRVPTKRPRPLSVPEHRLKPEGGAPPERRASRPAAVAMSGARRRALAGLRIVFGFAWGVDAWLKWQPAFLRGLSHRRTLGPAAAGEGLDRRLDQGREPQPPALRVCPCTGRDRRRHRACPRRVFPHHIPDRGGARRHHLVDGRSLRRSLQGRVVRHRRRHHVRLRLRRPLDRLCQPDVEPRAVEGRQSSNVSRAFALVPRCRECQRPR